MPRPSLPDPEKLRLRMAGLCSRSEQCTSDIRLKLRKAGLSTSKADEIIDFLTENKFLSDQRYARAYASYKVRFSAWGRLKIRAYLAQKRISSDLISEALDAIDENDYAEALDRAARAKAAALDPDNPADRQKIYRHLLSRGFESSLISRKIETLRNID